MEKMQLGRFAAILDNKIPHYPLSGQIELTYRCNLNCIHCYCKGSEDHKKELTTQQWQQILDVLQKEGCLSLCLTGGDPLIRKDFLKIYSCAKKKGFIITLFTNGLALTDKVIDYLAKSPPFSIEITLNGITRQTYEAITRVQGSFAKVTENIKKLRKRRLPLILKSNCLKQNKNEIAGVKAFTEEFLGRPPRHKYYFKYDPMIYPRINGDKIPTYSRLSFKELLEARKQDKDIWQEYQSGLHSDFPGLKRRNYLYQCNAWMRQFFINPYGRLKFCSMTEKFSADLKTTSFKDGFYRVFPRLLNEKFKTNSKCKDCRLRPICYHCPARAYLETGDEESPVPYYCQLAKSISKEMSIAGSGVTGSR